MRHPGEVPEVEREAGRRAVLVVRPEAVRRAVVRPHGVLAPRVAARVEHPAVMVGGLVRAVYRVAPEVRGPEPVGGRALEAQLPNGAAHAGMTRRRERLEGHLVDSKPATGDRVVVRRVSGSPGDERIGLSIAGPKVVRVEAGRVRAAADRTPETQAGHVRPSRVATVMIARMSRAAHTRVVPRARETAVVPPIVPVPSTVARCVVVQRRRVAAAA